MVAAGVRNNFFIPDVDIYTKWNQATYKEKYLSGTSTQLIVILMIIILGPYSRNKLKTTIKSSLMHIGIQTDFNEKPPNIYVSRFTLKYCSRIRTLVSGILDSTSDFSEKLVEYSFHLLALCRVAFANGHSLPSGCCS